MRPLPILTQNLQKHMPLLEELEMRTDTYNEDFEGWERYRIPFGPLKGLSKLHTLRVHADRLVLIDGLAITPKDDLQRYDPQEWFSPSLQHLEATSALIKRINAYVTEPAEEERRGSTMLLIVDTARAFPLKTLEVGIVVHGPDTSDDTQEVIFTGDTVELLNGLVNDAQERGVAFQVFNEGWEKKCVIYGPGNAN
jgi:hypothetical protein